MPACWIELDERSLRLTGAHRSDQHVPGVGCFCLCYWAWAISSCLAFTPVLPRATHLWTSALRTWRRDDREVKVQYLVVLFIGTQVYGARGWRVGVGKQSGFLLPQYCVRGTFISYYWPGVIEFSNSYILFESFLNSLTWSFRKMSNKWTAIRHLTQGHTY